MANSDLDGLAPTIEEAVRATPGVANLYRSGSLASNLVANAMKRLSPRAGDGSLVALSRGEGGIAVEVSVGVEETAAMTETLHAAHAAIAAVLAAAGEPFAGAKVTVVRVQA